MVCSKLHIFASLQKKKKKKEKKVRQNLRFLCFCILTRLWRAKDVNFVTFTLRSKQVLCFMFNVECVSEVGNVCRHFDLFTMENECAIKSKCLTVLLIVKVSNLK